MLGFTGNLKGVKSFTRSQDENSAINPYILFTFLRTGLKNINFTNGTDYMVQTSPYTTHHY